MENTSATGTWTCGICGKQQPATVGGDATITCAACFPAERERVEAARAEREESRRWAPQTEREARIEAQERASAEAGWRQDRGMGNVGGAEIFDE